MVGSQMAGYSPQVHPIHVHFQRLLPGFFIVGPRFWLRCVFDLAIHTSISLASCFCFSSSVLSFCSLAFWTFIHFPILAHIFATPLDLQTTSLYKCVVESAFVDCGTR